MSHIVKGKVKTKYTNEVLLKEAVNGLGIVKTKEKLYRVGAGFTSEKYDLVLIDSTDDTHRIGWNLKDGQYHQFQENYGSHGQWTNSVSQMIEDRYLAHHYKQALETQGFKVNVIEQRDGTIELDAVEAW
jgi:hypothetical protein